MSKKPIRFGVIGVGRIGKIHIENLATRIPGARVIAASDVDAAELQNVATRYGVAQTYADYRDLLALPELNAVVICSPTNRHYEMIIHAVSEGKHIFCESPSTWPSRKF